MANPTRHPKHIPPDLGSSDLGSPEAWFARFFLGSAIAILLMTFLLPLLSTISLPSSSNTSHPAPTPGLRTRQ